MRRFYGERNSGRGSGKAFAASQYRCRSDYALFVYARHTKVTQFTLSAKKFAGVCSECKTDSFSSIHSGEVAEHRRRLGMCYWRRASPVLTAPQNCKRSRAPRCSGAVVNKLLFKGGAKYGIHFPKSSDGLLL